MSKFVTARDVSFMNGINLEIINDVIETPIIFYSLVTENQDPNIYGESIDKLYEPGIKCNGLIQNDEENTDDSEFGPNVQQSIRCSFHRDTLKEKDFYPERGDIIKWNNAYFEISHVSDNQLLAGKEALPFSIITVSHMINKSSINIRKEM